jgi:serine/threonine-protein kinase
LEKILHYEGARKLGGEDKPDTYLSFDDQRDCSVVIRLLDDSVASDRVFRRQFDEKMRRLGRRDRHHIGEFFELESYHDRHFAVREYVEGTTVKELVTAEPFSYYLFLNMAIQIVKGLKVAHECGVVHGNISSHNIIISKRGEAKIVDFCLPGDRGRERSGSGNVGHVEYLSPEQLEGRTPSEASDFFALGVVFYEMLTGRLPFTGESQTSLREAILSDPPDMDSDPASVLPNDARLIIEKLLSRNPLHRGENARELQVTLEQMVGNQPAAAVVENSREDRWSPRTYMLVSILALLLMILWLVITTDFS